jgi:FkbM family methyltransferase
VAIPSFIKKFLRPIRETGLRFATSRVGVKRTVNGASFRVDARTRFLFPQVHDAAVTSAYSDRLAAGSTCWNIGANVGVHVLQLARIVGPTGRVVAFEPNPIAAALLRKNVSFNHFSDRVSVYEIAIGERNGTTEFFVAGAEPMGRAQDPNPLLARTRKIAVALRTIDDVLQELGQTPDGVVIDIEGLEIGALLSADRLLNSEPLPLLILELHPNTWTVFGHSREKLEEIIKRHHLRVEPLSGQADPLSDYGHVLMRRDETAPPNKA